MRRITRRISILPACLLTVVLTASAVGADAKRREIEPDEATGSSKAVVCPPHSWLKRTRQFLPVLKPEDKNETTINGQVEDVLRQCRWALGPFDCDRIVKLNVYVARDDLVNAVGQQIARSFATKPKPAITYVVSKLTDPAALVAVDAVALTNAPQTTTGEPLFRREGHSAGQMPKVADVAISFPEDVYISGQAEKADNAREATRKTLEGLSKTLDHLGLKESHIVQLKAFVRTELSLTEVQAEMESFLIGKLRTIKVGGALTKAQWKIAQSTGKTAKTPPTKIERKHFLLPPIVLVAADAGLPVEIELIAIDPVRKFASKEAVDYITPPWMPPSPVFCRVTRIAGGTRIYTSGLIASTGKDAAGQVDEVFGELGRLLKASGSDFQHLVKATYYVTDADASKRLNEIRPKFYDPKRPPAASKAMPISVGFGKRSIAIDMIAVQCATP